MDDATASDNNDEVTIEVSAKPPLAMLQATRDCSHLHSRRC